MNVWGCSSAWLECRSVTPEVAGSSPVSPAEALFESKWVEYAGAVAQLGERSVRNAEVRGSIPLGSTVRRLWSFATLAQLVEHVTRNDGVVGSNPTGGSVAGLLCPLV